MLITNVSGPYGYFENAGLVLGASIAIVQETLARLDR